MCWKPIISKTNKDMMDKETEEELWSARGRCSALEPQETTRCSVMVFHLKDLFSILVSSKGCKLQCMDFNLHSIRSSVLIFSLLTLYCCHRNGTTMHKIPVLWDRATVMVRLGTMLIGVQGNRQSRLQLRIQTRTPTAAPT
jgi:hypothetical protein